MTKPKILIWDIETSFINVLTFTLYPKMISPDNILEDWRIHCAAWKWYGEDKIHTAVERGRSDFNVVKKLVEVVSEADYIVHHNGDKFDLKKLNARVLRHGLSPVPPVKTLDTLKEVKKILSDTSHRLDYLGDIYDLSRKAHTRRGLWLDAFLGCKDALKEMVEYNKQDVVLQEKVFEKITPYIKMPINYTLFDADPDSCPRCGSHRLQKRGWSLTATGRKQRYQCQDCKGWSSSTRSERTTGMKP